MKKFIQYLIITFSIAAIGFIVYHMFRSDEKALDRSQPSTRNTVAELKKVAPDSSIRETKNSTLFAKPLYSCGSGTHEPITDLLDSVKGRNDPETRRLLEIWLDQNPDSAWRASLQSELARNYQRNGYFAEATRIRDALWDELKDSDEPTAQLIANEIAVALLKSNISLSRAKRLKQIIADVEQRTTNGTLEAVLYTARNTIWLTEHTGAQNITCGALALNALGHHLGTDYVPPSLGKVSGDYINTGLPLTQLSEFASANYKFDHVLVRRNDSSVTYPTPSVVHLDTDHYIAVTEFDATTQKYFIDDRTLNFNGWIEREALEESASGNLLLASNELPDGFAQLSDSEARRIFGRDGAHGGTIPEDSTTTDDDESGGDENSNCGMPRYAFHNMPATLVIRDTPIWYDTAAGPDLRFRLTYNELNGSRTFFDDYTGVGQDWNTDWISWVVPVDGEVTSNTTITLHAAGGGTHTHKFDSNIEPIPNPKNRSILRKISETEYTRTFPSGIVETYNTPDSTETVSKLFLTSLTDPAGNALNYIYETIDGNRRLKEITSLATGLTMQLFYDTEGLPFRLSRVKGPFGRKALIEYEDLTFNEDEVPLTYRIVAITDMNGLRSTFEYQDSDGFLKAMVTPYGRTTFEKKSQESNAGDSFKARIITATDPMGQKEKIAFVDLATKSSVYVAPDPIVKPNDSSLTYPDELTANTLGFYLDTLVTYRNTFYWSKEGYHHGSEDPENATITHYWTNNDWKYIPYKAGVRQPHSDWTWYSYPGSQNSYKLDTNQGGQPDKIISYSRVNGEVKANLTRIEYNDHQLVKKIIDVEGRETEFIYDTTFPTEIAEIRQKVGDGYATLSKTTYYSENRLPHVITDAAGRTTTFTYNDKGQVLTVTDDTLNRVTTYGYTDDNAVDDTDTSDDVYLAYIDQPFAGDSDRITFDYDDKQRLNKVTHVDGHYTVTAFDDFNRPTKVTFPDDTFIENTYENLHLTKTTDRLGRKTSYTVDPLQRVTSITNPLNLTTVMEWCRCGDIRKLIDPKGQETKWEYDSAGRLLKKRYADGSVDASIYDSVTGQLVKSTHSAIDVTIESVREGTADTYNTRVYDYFTDGRLAGINYEDEAIAGRSATPAVSYTYDPDYGRLKTMKDGIGRTIYHYYPHAVGKNGAGQLKSINGPWENDTIIYTYDRVGRLRKKTINNVAYFSGASYDKLDRLRTWRNNLGKFSISYVGKTHRVNRMLTPISKTIYGYEPRIKDFRLKKIHNLLTNNSNIDRFNYELNVQGRIDTITHKIGSETPLIKDYGYDALDQLTSAVISQGGTPQKHYAYTYDTAYNRASKQIGEYSSGSTHNEVNEHEESTGGGPTRFYGNVNEPARLTINGELAKLNTDNYFEGFLDLSAGNHDVIIEATDGNGNVATETFNVTVRSPDSVSYTYDNEGNTTTKTVNGVTTIYRWDAENRLVSIIKGDQLSEFYYDGLSRRVRIVEKTADVVTSDKRFIWCDGQIAEERNANNESMRYYFGNGETRTDKDPNPGNYYYTSDHLGSTQTVLDSAGTIVARYEYTPYGEVTRTQGTLNFDFLYTGHYRHEPSNLFLTHYRAYDSTQGRWLSRDPIAENGGINLYAYVGNDPINAMDPLGLVKYSISSLSQMSHADQVALFNEFGLDGDCFSDNLFAEAAKMIATDIAISVAISAATGGGGLLLKTTLKRSKFVANKTVRVTSWTGGGKTPDLNPGRWVVKGEATKWNFFRTGLGGPKTSSKFPFIKGPEKPFKSITRDVPASSLVSPKTSLKEPFAIIKRAFGQYQIK